MREIVDQAWRIRFVVLGVLVPVIGLLAIAVAMAAILDESVEMFTRDPLAELDAYPLTGFVSNLGIVLWSAAVGTTFLAALALRRRGGSGEAVRFFLASGALTTVLLLDDLFQFHELIGPTWLHLPQRGIYVVYVLVTAAYLWRFRRFLLGADYLLLVLAGTFFALSITIDLLPLVVPVGELGPLEDVVEDGSKLIGIAFWLGFFVRTALTALEGGAGLPPPARPAPAP